ncbi:hypothetical protein E4T38_01226 [Aureobasidium subglaciale]|nr:hypothetical protein E4T38_01226 [Aureobasidium subglaciale]KAI5230256.1 hypothetical protein E4T40_01227 [Aureobasidium subglaciale]KAI5233539.1 hypothetical protein E4T41_01225 [Aureobasidium subglaciale]KAI5266919.1 hypothetical protein E4T46_01225 [Aureobasidium subglaciale]
MLLGTAITALVLQSSSFLQLDQNRAAVASVCSSSTIVLAVYPTPITANNGSVSTSYSLSLVDEPTVQPTTNSTALLTTSSTSSSGSVLSDFRTTSSTITSLMSAATSTTPLNLITTSLAPISSPATSSASAISIAISTSSASIGIAPASRAFISCPADDGIYYADTNDRVYQLRCNTDEPEATIGTSYRSRLQDCVEACSMVEGCLSVSYVATSGLCSYKGNEPQLKSLIKRQDSSTTDSAIISDYTCPEVDGTRLVDSSGSLYETRCNTFLPASSNSTTVLSADDLASCFNYCSNTNGCSSFTYQNESCTLITNSNSADGVYQDNVATAYLLGTRSGLIVSSVVLSASSTFTTSINSSSSSLLTTEAAASTTIDISSTAASRQSSITVGNPLSLPTIDLPSLSIPTINLPSLSLPSITIPISINTALVPSNLLTTIGTGGSLLQTPTPIAGISGIASQASSLLSVVGDQLTLHPSELPLPSTIPPLLNATTFAPVITAIPSSLIGVIASDVSVIASGVNNAASSLLSQATGVLTIVGDPLTLLPSSLPTLPTISAIPGDILTTLAPVVAPAPSIVSVVVSDLGDALSSVVSDLPIASVLPTSLVGVLASDISAVASGVGNAASSVLAGVSSLLGGIPQITATATLDLDLPSDTALSAIVPIVSSGLGVLSSISVDSTLSEISTIALPSLTDIVSLPSITQIMPLQSITAIVSLPTILTDSAILDATTLLSIPTNLPPAITNAASLPTTITIALPSPTCLRYDQLLNLCMDSVTTTSGELPLSFVTSLDPIISIGSSGINVPSVSLEISSAIPAITEIPIATPSATIISVTSLAVSAIVNPILSTSSIVIAIPSLSSSAPLLPSLASSVGPGLSLGSSSIVLLPSSTLNLGLGLPGSGSSQSGVVSPTQPASIVLATTTSAFGLLPTSSIGLGLGLPGSTSTPTVTSTASGLNLGLGGLGSSAISSSTTSSVAGLSLGLGGLGPVSGTSTSAVATTTPGLDLGLGGVGSGAAQAGSTTSSSSIRSTSTSSAVGLNLGLGGIGGASSSITASSSSVVFVRTTSATSTVASTTPGLDLGLGGLASASSQAGPTNYQYLVRLHKYKQHRSWTRSRSWRTRRIVQIIISFISGVLNILRCIICVVRDFVSVVFSKPSIHDFVCHQYRHCSGSNIFSGSCSGAGTRLWSVIIDLLGIICIIDRRIIRVFSIFTVDIICIICVFISILCIIFSVISAFFRGTDDDDLEDHIDFYTSHQYSRSCSKCGRWIRSSSLAHTGSAISCPDADATSANH